MNVVVCTRCGSQNPTGSRFCTNCGNSLQQTHAHSGLMPGTRLRDRYIIGRVLGQGGFGRTYLAQDTGRFNEPIAIKEFTPSVQGTQAFQKAEELFQREAATLHRLQHPQIPRLWELFEDNKRLFLVEDYIEGETYQSLLNQRLQQGRGFSEIEIIQLLRQLLPVLSYLHRQGVIHRDISPDNIILSAKMGVPVLIDMGGVKQAAIDVATQVAGSENPSRGMATRLGKVGYAPDEQLRMGIVAPNSDLYALAVTALVLMTGQQPPQLIDPYTMNWKWNQYINLSPHLSNILSKMLANEPYRRFQSAEEILKMLEPNPTHVEQNLNQADFVTPPENPSKPRPTSRGKRLLNSLLDSIFCVIFWIVFFLITLLMFEVGGFDTSQFSENTLGSLMIVSFYAAYFIYYIPEAMFGKSLAKLITRTKVVTNAGKKPGFLRIIGRTIARFIPFDAFSFLFSANPIGWHDSLSGTIVIDRQR